jgi:excisionase family DNA binding protein
MSVSSTDKLLVPAAEAARMLSVGRSTFFRYVKDGKLPKPVDLGGLTRWRVSDLRQHIGDPANSTTTP